MYKILIIAMLLWIPIHTGAQMINKAEYFIDNDPGFSKATQVIIATPAADLTIPLTIDLTGKGKGFHCLYFRCRDNTGKWSNTYNRLLYVLSASDIAAASVVTKGEYFIDADPGYGKGTAITIPSPATDLTLSFTGNLSGLTRGFHTLNIRVFNQNGKWSLASTHLFYIFTSQNTTANIVFAEYYIDTDPGRGKAVPVVISSPGSTLTLQFTANLSQVIAGSHTLNIRLRDSDNKWSFLLSQTFTAEVSTGSSTYTIKNLYSIYPNPAHRVIHIEIGENFPGTPRIIVKNIQGKILIEKTGLKSNITKIALNTPGEYFITIQGDHFIKTEKIIVE
jgi:hypothetical protein